MTHGQSVRMNPRGDDRSLRWPCVVWDPFLRACLEIMSQHPVLLACPRGFILSETRGDWLCHPYIIGQGALSGASDGVNRATLRERACGKHVM